MNNDVIDIAKKLIEFRSFTPNEAGSIDYIINLLEKYNFRIFRHDFGPGEQVANLYAVIGSGSPNICFAGHVDVVPTGDEASWRFPPFTPTIEDDILYGRGVVDMKAAIAASLAAVLNLIDKDPAILDKISISFLITADEEGTGEFGTKMLLEEIYSKNHKIDFAIVGEPTCADIFGDQIKIGGRGSINFDLLVKGIQGHVAYSDKALNPNHLMNDIINNLKNYQFDQGSEFFEKTAIQITSIDTDNDTVNLIPEICRAKFNIRFNDQHTVGNIVDKVKEITSNIAGENYEIKFHSSAGPFICHPNKYSDKFKEIIKATTGIDSRYSTLGGTSDARFIIDYCKVLEFGLFTQTAHKIDESAKISDLQMLYNVYYNFLASFSCK